MHRDNQPTFNANRKVYNYQAYLQNKEAEEAKLKKASLQSKENSEDQQHIGNKRTEFNPITRKQTDYSDDEIRDLLDALDKEEDDKEKK